MDKTLDITKVANGALQEQIAIEWRKLLTNMQDPNTGYKPKRTLIIKLTCEQNEKRTQMIVDGEVTSKLAPINSVVTNYATGKDLQTGEVFAEEYTTIDRRQVSLPEYTINEDGEVLDGPTEVESAVIDLRKVR